MSTIYHIRGSTNGKKHHSSLHTHQNKKQTLSVTTISCTTVVPTTAISCHYIAQETTRLPSRCVSDRDWQGAMCAWGCPVHEGVHHYLAGLPPKAPLSVAQQCQTLGTPLCHWQCPSQSHPQRGRGSDAVACSGTTREAVLVRGVCILLPVVIRGVRANTPARVHVQYKQYMGDIRTSTYTPIAVNINIHTSYLFPCHHFLFQQCIVQCLQRLIIDCKPIIRLGLCTLNQLCVYEERVCVCRVCVCVATLNTPLVNNTHHHTHHHTHNPIMYVANPLPLSLLPRQCVQALYPSQPQYVYALFASTPPHRPSS